MIPDISWLADPESGLDLIITFDAAGDQGVFVGGGTSQSCPMFSALWGIATQAAGHPLGQAAALIYRLDSNAITDIVPVDSRTDVTGTIEDAGGVTVFNKWLLAGPLQNSPAFYSALIQGPEGNWNLQRVGTDSTLATGPGWDNVTGLGVPNPPEFVMSLARHWQQ